MLVVMLSKSVSTPPVAPSTSIRSMPVMLPIPFIRPVSAMQADLSPYFSWNGCTSGTAPAPRGNMMLAGFSPFFILSKFTGWSFKILYDFCISSFSNLAVLLASSDPSMSTTCFGGFPSYLGSASDTWSDKLSPLRTSTARCPVDSLKITCTPYSKCKPLMAWAISFVPSLILPARRSVIIPLSLAVEKLQRKAISPG